MGFSSDVGTVDERSRTNLGRAAQDLFGEAGEDRVVFAMEVAMAEARSSGAGSAIDQAMWIHKPWRDLPRSYTVDDDLAGTNRG